MILLIDHYDSFSYNLYQYLGEIDPNIRVIRSDEMTVEEIKNLHPSHIVLSPGPGRPEDAGVYCDVIQRLGSTIPILGVCLGHQAICLAHHADITYAKKLMHGKTSIISIDLNSILFQGIEEKEIKVARYHSLVASFENFPSILKVTATSKDHEIMAVEHCKYPIYGVQFHPESMMTPDGKTILKNFILKGRKK